jgi:hypothetical protein
MQCNMAIWPPQSSISSSRGNRSSRKKRFLHHVVLCL